MSAPNCYDCVHRRDVPGDAHSACANHAAVVTGDRHGVREGWFFWPINFDPVWLRSCDGFAPKEQEHTHAERMAQLEGGE
jgi:hypothetical protein